MRYKTGIKYISLVVVGIGFSIGQSSIATATEGALGRPIAGASVVPSAGVVPDEPIWLVNLGEAYLNGSIGQSHSVPIAGKTSLGVEAEAAFTMATLMKVWGTGIGAWNFASSVTLPYLWTEARAAFAAGPRQVGVEQTASNLFDLNFSPIIAGYQLSNTDHIALSLNIWAPTGQYDFGSLVNTSLNNWTFTPQIAYTKYVPAYNLEFDAVAGVQFYTRNHATNYQNAPIFTLDVMAVKRFTSGLGVGLILGTVQQLGNDSGPTADALNGFVGRDFAMGPIVTYDTKIGGKHPFSFSFRWVPTVASTRRLNSTATFMTTATMVF
ncbi:transporter [Paraburkholderia sp. LEh10]|uniref:SphA family protein n=1 Tax=Paraburkholderia sp. LEh10 TaxID=2821353 RepID=UPI001AEAA609|nr:transporter [Paraburkholderia sp. LEh10]MBP0595102.1 transporter [Paraburkholderia sp. LEh10]